MDYLDYDVDLTWLENIMAADILALNSWEDNCCRCWLDFTWHTDYGLSWQLCWLDLKTLADVARERNGCRCSCSRLNNLKTWKHKCCRCCKREEQPLEEEEEGEQKDTGIPWKYLRGARKKTKTSCENIWGGQEKKQKHPVKIFEWGKKIKVPLENISEGQDTKT